MTYKESSFECDFIEKLKTKGWQYSSGIAVSRAVNEAIIKEDLISYLNTINTFTPLTNHEKEEIISNLKNISSGSTFIAYREIIQLLQNGFTFKRHESSLPSIHIDYLNFDRPEGNIFRCVNQLTFKEGNQERRPDILLFINGIPLCIIELKSPLSQKANVKDAWEQIYYRYKRDIPTLIKYCALSVISDGATTCLGTPFTNFEYFYAWKKVSNDDKTANGLNQLDTLISGALEPERFLSIYRDFLFLPDIGESQYKEQVFVCRYPQFFATRKLFVNVLLHLKTTLDDPARDGKGGTYFGATGCGKTMTMLFLARQLIKRTQLSPTILIIVDREDLQSQAAKVFATASDFLGDSSIRAIQSREDLKNELSVRKAGGVFVTTVQKFCESTGLLSDRNNIICLSDEAHRSQLGLGDKLTINPEKKTTEVRFGLAKYLHDAFPNATYVGFTGTPLAETVQVFGGIVDSYPMEDSVNDGITVPLKYEPRLARVMLDEQEAKKIESYYETCENAGTSPEAIEKSKKAMAGMEVILSNDDRLEKLASDVIQHYETYTGENPDVSQKAMILCANRNIAYRLYEKIAKQKPEWLVPRRVANESLFNTEEQRALLQTFKELPALAMVATRSPNDPKEMYDLLGDKSYQQILAREFKKPESNFKIAIVVDMWITGFDVPCLSILYNDKPLQRHNLIQAISRVNRKFPGKEFGLIVDYLGIRENMKKALKQFGGKTDNPGGGGTADPIQEAQEAYRIFSNELAILKGLFNGFDASNFINDKDSYQCLADALEFVLSQPITQERDKDGNPLPFIPVFKRHVQILRGAFGLCQCAGLLNKNDPDESKWAHFFMGVLALLSKTTVSGFSVGTMNKHVENLVQNALSCTGVELIINQEKSEDIFSQAFIDELNQKTKPATRMHLLARLLQREIKAYGKTNAIKAQEFTEKLQQVLEQYNHRDSLTFTTQTVGETITQLLDIAAKLKADKEEFKKLGIDFEEKAFYDILVNQRETHGFEYPDEKIIQLSRQIRTLIEYIPVIQWLDNSNLRNKLQYDLTVLLYENGYPPSWNEEVFEKVINQVENYKKYQ